MLLSFQFKSQADVHLVSLSFLDLEDGHSHKNLNYFALVTTSEWEMDFTVRMLSILVSHWYLEAHYLGMVSAKLL